MHLNKVDFEFDPGKSAANHDKRGIDFDSAQALWEDVGLVILPSRYREEPRFLAIAPDRTATLDGNFHRAR